MTKKQRALKLIEGLKVAYPLAECTLDYAKAYELLIGVRLAAQCTDARVNVVTAELFKLYPTLEAVAGATVDEIEAIVRPCGLGHTKARDIVAACKMLIDEYGGNVPDTMEELLTLPGVGRKSANLILGDVFARPAVVVDTHCIRITNLMGLSEGKNPAAVEKQLAAILPPEESNDFCHRLVMHGRAVCVARRPQCGACNVAEFCKFGGALKNT
jgi:endonuclease-3